MKNGRVKLRLKSSTFCPCTIHPCKYERRIAGAQPFGQDINLRLNPLHVETMQNAWGIDEKLADGYD